MVAKTGSDDYIKEVLSSDEKPTDAFSGQQIIETDTGTVWEWSGESGSWIKIRNAGRTLIDPSFETSSFGELSVTELTPIIQLNFNYNINEEMVNVLDNNGTSSIVSNLLNLSTGAQANASSVVNSRIPIKYNSGQGVQFRSSGIFSTGVEGNTQIIGAGDSGDGLFFGYQDAEFGVFKRSGGIPEGRAFTITAASSTAEDITITLDGDTVLVPVTASGVITTTANEIGAADYSDVGRGWEVHVDGPDVEFISYDSTPRTGAYSVTATDVTATIAQDLVGTSPVGLFIAQTDWNRDKADGSSELPAMDWTKGHVFQIQYQWLGFGILTFSVENPSTGKFIPVHQIEYAGANVLPSLGNPHLQLCGATENTTNTTDVVVKVGSMGGFIEGKTNGSHFHNGVEGFKASVGTTELPILTLHNKKTYVGNLNKIRVKLIFASVAADGNKNVTFRFKANATLAGANFTEVEPDLSIIEVDTSATAVSGGDEQFTVATAKVGSETLPLATSSFYLNPGDFMTITAQSAPAGTADVTCSFNWEELF